MISLNLDISSLTQEKAERLENFYPILNPISASFKANESFAPSPIKATYSLFFYNFLRYSSTILSFYSGLHLAKTRVYFRIFSFKF